MCGLVRHIDSEGKSTLVEIIPVAGDIDGHKLDEQVSLLNATEAGGKSRGVRVEFNGGNNFAKHKQRAVVDFVCDPSTTGENDDAITFLGYNWSESVEKDVLTLEWKTKMACEENAKGDKKSDGETKSSHWGFFTWMFIMYAFPPFRPPSHREQRTDTMNSVFLGAAAYLIFVVWLGYVPAPFT